MSLERLAAAALRGTSEDRIAYAVARHRAGEQVSPLEVQTGLRPIVALLPKVSTARKWREEGWWDESLSRSRSRSRSLSRSLSRSRSRSLSRSRSRSRSLSLSRSLSRSRSRAESTEE